MGHGYQQTAQSTKAADYDKLAEIQDALRTGTLTDNLRQRAQKMTMSKNDILSQKMKNINFSHAQRMRNSVDNCARMKRQKSKYEILEKVKYNQVQVAKDKQSKLESIIKRSIKKERLAEKYMKNVKYDNKELKKKKDERRRTAIDKVRTDYISHTNAGMDYYKNVLSEIDNRTQNKEQKERAKSA